MKRKFCEMKHPLKQNSVKELTTSSGVKPKATGDITIRHIKRFVPHAYTLIEDSAKTLVNKAGRKVFGPSAEEIVQDLDLGDKKCLITGANSGIGLEMTRCLNARDCHVLMACRNTYTADVIGKQVCKNPDRLSVSEVNLASLRSVKNFTDRLVAEEEKFDIVILNAGVFGIPRTLTEDGLETIFQVNYLSHLYMVLNIEQLLAPDARVVFLASESHRYVHWPLENKLLPSEEMLSLSAEEYTSIKAFNVSKLCNIFAMHYLGYRWMGTKRCVFAASPGSFIRTKLSSNWWAYDFLYLTMQPFNKSVSQAAATPLYCATSPALEGLSALYCKDCRRCEESELAMDSHLALRLVDMSQRMLDERGFRADASQPAPAAASAPHQREPDEDELMSSYSG